MAVAAPMPDDAPVMTATPLMLYVPVAISKPPKRNLGKNAGRDRRSGRRSAHRGRRDRDPRPASGGAYPHAGPAPTPPAAEPRARGVRHDAAARRCTSDAESADAAGRRRGLSI